MGRKAVKFGKVKSFYLTNEAIKKLLELGTNSSSIIEILILKEWHEKQLRLE